MPFIILLGKTDAKLKVASGGDLFWRKRNEKKLGCISVNKELE